MSVSDEFQDLAGGVSAAAPAWHCADRRSFYVTHGKRAVDLSLVFLSLPISAVIIAVLFARQVLRGRRCLVRVVRIGRRGARFGMIQMPGAGDRSTRLGVDRLPMLWNVWRGNMSLIGPKPMTCEAACAHRGASYFHLRPGLIDPAEVLDGSRFRAANDPRRNAEYVMKQGLFYDLFILCRYCFQP